MRSNIGENICDQKRSTMRTSGSCYISEKDTAPYVGDLFQDAVALGLHLRSTAAKPLGLSAGRRRYGLGVIRSQAKCEAGA